MTTFLPSSHKFAIACGTAGAFVEVTSEVLFNEGAITRSWGRQDAFSDATPGTFSFTLDNRDGKYTPGFVTGIAPVVLPLAKGMGVSWELNGQIRSGRIRSVVPVFPPEGKPDAARVRVTADDVLAIAARTGIDSLPQAMTRAALPYLWWPLDDVVNSPVAVEKSGNSGPALSADDLGKITFGVSGVPAVGASQVRIFPPSVGGVLNPDGLQATSGFPAITYPANSGGSWGVWFTPSTDNQAGMLVNVASAGGNAASFQITTLGGYYGIGYIVGATVPSVVPVRANVPVYLSVSTAGVLSGTWTITQTLSVNGVAVASQSTSGVATYSNADRQITSVRIGYRSGMLATESGAFSNLSHTPSPVDEYSSAASTEAQRLNALAAAIPALTLDTLPADLGTSMLGVQSDGSVLDMFNTVIRGEQGHIYSVSSGTLLAPVEKVRIRGRTRPAAVTATFLTSADIIGAPDMGYETTNTVSAVTVNGSGASFTVTDKTLEPSVGTANTSAAVAFTDITDLRAFGEDRIDRGIATGIDVFSIVVNARSTTTSRWADLLGLTPGLRYRVDGLPNTQIGFTYWDGWFLGASEVHDQENNLFTLYFERTLPATAVFDTDRFMSGGENTLSATINSAVTSISVATTGARMNATDVPYTIIIDSEILNVTAASGATPQVLTVQRAQSGTTAAAHTAGAAVEITPASLLAY